MSNCPVDLDSLLIRLGLEPTGQIERIAREIYEERYVAASHQTHDGQPVIFYSNQFLHAFRHSFGGTKNEIDRERVERIAWIGALLAGTVAKSACWLVPPTIKNPSERRLYVIKHERYVLWLEPTAGCGWRFSSAYKAFDYQLKKYVQDATEIWKFGV